MARPRLPQQKAEVSGAQKKNPQRFAGRTTVRNPRPIGEPYVTMTAQQRTVWEECRVTMPWLHAGHRLLLRQVCILSARMEDPDVGVNALHALSAALSKLGATPTDETKVMHRDGDDDADPDDKYFGRPN